MKKSLLFLASAALVLASCNNDVKIDENTVPVGSNAQKEIAFTSYAQTAKRAASQSGAIETASFPTGLDMMVTAYDVTHTRPFFKATPFKYKFAGGSYNVGNAAYWGGDPARYWPLSAAYVNFLAITNANSDNTTSVTWAADSASQVTVAMSDNYAIATAQRDFMYAIGHAEVTQTGNALTFPDPVDMVFKHAQAYLVFNLKAADAASQAIKIKNIEICKARFAGTATIAHTNYNGTSAQATTLYWNPTTQTNDYVCVLDNQTPKADEAASVALTTGGAQLGKIMVVPNMSAADTYISNDGTKIKISYYLDQKLYTYEYTVGNDIYEAGKKYIYDITFKLHEITINPSVETWTVGGVEYIEIPVMAYGADRAVSVTKEAQKLVFTVDGLNGSKKIKVTKGGAAGDAQVDSTDPTLNSVVAESGTAQKVTITLKANTGSAQTMTVTIQEYETDGTTPAGDPTVITITQAAGA